MSQPNARDYSPNLAHAEYKHQGDSKSLNLERDISPIVCETKAAFWNAEWQIGGLWPHEQLQIILQGVSNSYRAIVHANSQGYSDIFTAAAFEIHLKDRDNITLALLRQGFKEAFHLAAFKARVDAAEEFNKDKSSAFAENETTAPKTVKHRLSIIITGFRDSTTQASLVEALDNLFTDHYSHRLCNEKLYPDGERAQGSKLLIKEYGFTKLQSDELKNLRTEVRRIVDIANQQKNLNVGIMSANWERS